VHACFYLARPVAARWERGGCLRGGVGCRGRGHEVLEGGLVGCVAGAEEAVLPAEFGGGEGDEGRDARADFCEEKSVRGEGVEGVGRVDGGVAGEEEQVHAGSRR